MQWPFKRHARSHRLGGDDIVGIIVEESDGSPSVKWVSKIIVTNGDLTDNGDGSVTIATGGLVSAGTVIVQEGDVSVDTAATTLDFGTGFDVTSSPAGEANIALDLSEISAGGELGGTMDAPTVDATHSGSAHHTRSHGADGASDHSYTGIKQTLLLTGWKPTTTAGCGARETNEIGATTKHDVDGPPFDATTAENAYISHPMPDNWDGSTVTFRVWWYCKTGYVVTTSDGVAWGLKAVATTDADDIDTAWGTEVVVTDVGTANNRRHKTADSTALTIGNTPAAGDWVDWNLRRVVSDAADDWAADAYPTAVVVEYGISAMST